MQIRVLMQKDNGPGLYEWERTTEIVSKFRSK